MKWATPEGVAEVLALVGDLEPNAAGYVHVRCPFCYSHRKSLYYRPDSGWFACWRCETKAWSRGKPDGPTSYEEDLRPPPGYIPMPAEFELLEHDPLPLRLHPYVRYLLGRGLEVDTILDVGIGACLSGELSGFVVVPVDVGGLQVGWVARHIVHKKYMTPPAFPRDRVLLNQDVLAEVTDEPIAVVEGPFDALRHWPRAVACFGQPTEEHFQVLLGAQRPLCMMLDADRRDHNRSWAQRLWMHGKDVSLAEVPAGKDPGKITHEDFLALLSSRSQAVIF